MMNSEKAPAQNGPEKQKAPVAKTMISDALKGLSEVKTAKINIEKVFVLNEKCFVKGIKPASGNVVQLQNANSLPNSKVIQAKKGDGDKKSNENRTIETKSGNKPTLQISGNNTKKIIISGTKAVNDVETLKKLISQLANANNISNNQIIVNEGTKKIIIQNTSTDDVNVEKTVAQSQSTKRDVKIVRNDETKDTKHEKSAEKSRKVETKSISDEKNRVSEFQKKPQQQSVTEQPKPVKQKRFLYRLKSKNGKILTYTSDVPIRLKRPKISLTKMTQADVKRLSKEFAEKTKKKNEEMSKRENDAKKSTKKPAIEETKKEKNSSIQKSGVSLRSGKSTNATVNAEASDTPSTPTYGVQTRKRRIKFLSDGRILKDKKSRRESTSSTSTLSSTSSSDKEKDPTSSSDEDYKELSEFIKFKKDTKTANKTSLSKKPVAGKQLNKTVPVAKSSNQKPNLSASIKTAPSCNLSQPTESANEVTKKLPIEPALLLSSLLGVKVLPSQLNTVRFKPKSTKERTMNNISVLTRNAVLQTSSEPLIMKPTSSNLLVPKALTILRTNTEPSITKQTTPITSTPKNPIKIAPKSVSSEPPPLSYFSKPNSKPIRPSLVKSATEPVKISSPKSSPLKPVESNLQSVSKSAPSLSFNESPAELLAKINTFTDTKIVKTKEGPKKYLLDKVGQIDSPKTIYDVMSEIFDTMPSWNIHILPDNKSFCLAQVSRSRMGVPVLKKCIELNCEFMAKVYVHQLHCKRYDGIYDTESKLKKLINDIDALVV